VNFTTVAEEGFPRIVVSDDLEALAVKASELVLSYIAESIESRGQAQLILAGGSTPKRTYSLIASGISCRSISSEAIEWYFGDERWVLPTDQRSNEGMAREALLGPISAPEGTIHSWMPARGDPVECARRYGETLRLSFRGRSPDILLLGIGPDGHTASLFTGATAFLPDGQEIPVGPRLSEVFPAVAIRGGSAPPGWRLTLSPDFLRTSRHVVFIAAGADKAGSVSRAVSGDLGTPAAWIRGATTHFIVTRDAAPQQG
jgi:6-phosphogluconolactonase